MSRPVFGICVAALLGATLLLNLSYVVRSGDGLTPFNDAYSEAGVIRAGERFARDGFLVDNGLADLSYGDKYPGIGIDGPSGSRPDDPIYQGYPPGPEWLGGLYTRWLGPDHVRLYRLFPVGLAVIAAGVFLIGCAGPVGRMRTLFVFIACLMTPMFTRLPHGLHYQGYALSLLMIQAMLVIRIFGRRGQGQANSRALLGFFVLGFFQGWLSFDFCFLVTFMAFPLAMAATPRARPIYWRSVLFVCAATGLGFVFAHGLHFLQSVLYMGGVREALEEFAFRSKKMYNTKALFEGRSRIEIIDLGLWSYLRAYLRWNDCFSMAGEVLLAALGVAMIVTRIKFAVGPWRLEAIIRRPSTRDLVALGTAVLVGLAWFFAKPAHALNHLHLMIVHLFLFYLTCSLVFARSISMLRCRRRGVRDHGREPEELNASDTQIPLADNPAMAMLARKTSPNV